MKKRFFKLTLPFFVTALMIYNASGASWYTKVCENHARPELPDFKKIEENGGIVLGKDEKKVYLTFDAGYENGNVKRIADILKKNDVKGAFFILSNLVHTNPELVKQLADDGNLICNHTRKHPDMSVKNESEFKKELTSMEEYFKEQTGKEIAKFYRPPEGKYTMDNLKWAKDMGYKTVFWSIAYSDWDNNNQMKPEKALNILLGRVHNGAVILLHPTSATNAEILDDFIKRLKAEGYEFGLIDEIR